MLTEVQKCGNILLERRKGRIPGRPVARFPGTRGRKPVQRRKQQLDWTCRRSEWTATKFRKGSG